LVVPPFYSLFYFCHLFYLCIKCNHLTHCYYYYFLKLTHYINKKIFLEGKYYSFYCLLFNMWSLVHDLYNFPLVQVVSFSISCKSGILMKNSVNCYLYDKVFLLQF
jgi:hypothetical protein